MSSPIEAEWGYAAAGGTLYLPYPWSSDGATILADEARAHANVADLTGSSFNLVEVGRATGALPSIFGPFDLAGNANEMVRDWVGKTANLAMTSTSPPISAGMGIEVDGRHNFVVRGGSYNFAPRIRAHRLSQQPG